MKKMKKVSIKTKKTAPKKTAPQAKKPVIAKKKDAGKIKSSLKNTKTSKKKAPVKKVISAKGKALPVAKKSPVPAKKPATLVKKTVSPKVDASSKKSQVKGTPAKTSTKKAISKSTSTTKFDPISENPKFPEFKGKKRKYYELLLAFRDQISGQIKFLSGEALDSQSSGLAGSISNHMADYGSDNFLHDMELNMITDEGEVIEMIDEAIQRLDSGDYGKCIECGCTIPDKRLEVKPYAKFCVKCKSIHEANGDITP